MHSLYSFLTGPMVWVSLLILVFGLIGKFIYLTNMAKKRDPYVFNYLQFKYALRSILIWFVPFATRNMRLNPAMTVVTFAFHICLILVPFLTLAHIVMWEEAWGFGWWNLPETIAVIMSFIVLAGIVFFVARRIKLPEARYVTRTQDFLILIIVALPYLTGILAYYQIFDYQTMIILHIISGHLMLIAIPFTWLSHLLLYPMIRGYTGSEFGGVRKAKDW
jgi:nitrate reductase gamma subunit